MLSLPTIHFFTTLYTGISITPISILSILFSIKSCKIYIVSKDSGIVYIFQKPIIEK